MFERFTETARQVVVQAQEEARGLGHNYIGTEHLLLGLLAQPDTGAARALQNSGITPESARDAVVETVGRSAEPSDGQIPFTPRSKKVLELAFRESLSLGHRHVSPEHVLLALIREREGIGSRIVVQAGIDLAQLREAVLERLPSPDSEEPRPAPRPAVTTGFTVRPDAEARRLFMRVGAQALSDGRDEFTTKDLVAVLVSDDEIRAQIITALDQPT